MSVFNYRNKIVGRLAEWMRERQAPLYTRYYGGPVSDNEELEGDSLLQCIHYLDTALAGNLNDVLPRFDNKNGFSAQGFLLSQDTVDDEE